MTEKELRKTMTEEEYLRHYEEMVLAKVERGEELLPSEDAALSSIKMGHALSIAGIELVEHLAD